MVNLYFQICQIYQNRISYPKKANSYREMKICKLQKHKIQLNSTTKNEPQRKSPKFKRRNEVRCT